MAAFRSQNHADLPLSGESRYSEQQRETDEVVYLARSPHGTARHGGETGAMLRGHRWRRCEASEALSVFRESHEFPDVSLVFVTICRVFHWKLRTFCRPSCCDLRSVSTAPRPHPVLAAIVCLKRIVKRVAVS